MKRRTLLLIGCLTLSIGNIGWADDAEQANVPLKVYVLVGQSNMQGHAEVRTLQHLGMDPKTAPLLKDLMNDDGEPVTCDHVWISSIGHDGQENERHGKLTSDYGASGRGPKFGPEFGFGVYMHQRTQQPMLIIKAAWGGKSLHTDFRPPSAGPYELNEKQREDLKRRNHDVDVAKARRAAASGRYYRLMLSHVQKVLADIERVCPDYKSESGYELAGFVWFQGWNDMVDGGVYPNRGQPGGYDAYSELMATFIRDVRRDLNAPEMPFVIGVMGAGGPVANYGPRRQRYAKIHQGFRDAMAAPAELPEFEGNVHVVRTENYWDAKLTELDDRNGQVNAKRRELNQNESLTSEQRTQQLEEFTKQLFTDDERNYLQTGKSNAEYHYLGAGKVIVQIGKAFAEALAERENTQPADEAANNRPLDMQTLNVQTTRVQSTTIRFPQKAVLPITEPPCSYCSTQHLKSLIEPKDRVIAWLRAAHNGGAFPIRHFLSGPRVVNDTYGLFFYDPDGGYVAAFKKDYGYQLHGWRRGVMVVKGKDGTLWSALTGIAFEGPQKGKQLERIPSLVTDWNYWLMLHPESTTYDLFDGKKYATQPLPTTMSESAAASMGDVDSRLDAQATVMGVEFPTQQKAYRLDGLPERACLLDEADELPIAVFWYGRTKSAVVFDRRIDGQTLTLYADGISPESAPFKDRETGTRWSVAGRGIDGPLRGKELKWVNSIQCRWYAWSAEYPETEVSDDATK